MHMDLGLGIALFGAAATAANLLNAWLTNGVRMEIANLKLEIADTRVKDREWMEAKFITRPEFEQRFLTLTERTGIKLH